MEEYTVRKSTEELQTNEFKGLQELLIRVNMTRDSMDEDEDIVLPVNFSAVGVILLEFKNALAEHMVGTQISLFCSLIRVF